MNRLIRSIAARFRSSLVALRYLRLRLSGRQVGLAIVYHALAERSGDPDRELVPPLGVAHFERQVRHLRRRYRLVAASDLLAAASSRRRGQQFPVAITFDDDLRSHKNLAMPILNRLGAPATFFLCGASFDGPNPFWWEWMQVAFDRQEQRAVERMVAQHREEGSPHPSPTTIHELAGAVERLPAPARDAVAAELGNLVGPYPLEAGLAAADVQMLSDAGFELGFHTRRHDMLPPLDDAALAEALTSGRERIGDLADDRLRCIAYPHGRVDQRVAEAARRSGFAFGFTTEPRIVGSDDDPLRLGRIQPPFGAGEQFASRLVTLLRG